MKPLHSKSGSTAFRCVWKASRLSSFDHASTVSTDGLAAPFGKSSRSLSRTGEAKEISGLGLSGGFRPSAHATSGVNHLPSSRISTLRPSEPGQREHTKWIRA